MELLKFQQKKKKDKFYNLLLDSLFALQKDLDAQKDSFSLNDFLLTIGDVLEKNSISILLTIFSEKKETISIRYLNDTSDEKSLRKSFDYFFLDSVISLKETNHFSRVYFKKRSQYIKERQRDIYRAYPETKEYLSNCFFNSIVCPILIKGEVIGFFEFISPQLKKEHLEVFEVFVRGLVKSISNSMLFEELKVSEEKFRDIFENADEGFYVLNGKKKKFVEVNKALAKISGYTREELLQMSYLLIFSLDERDRIDSYVKHRLKNGDSGDSPKSYETKIQCKNGDEKNIKLNISKYLNTDEWFVIISDITDSKIIQERVLEARKHYLSIIDTIRDGIFVVDKELKIITYNRFFSEKVKLAVETIKNKECYYVLPKYENNLFLKELKKEKNMSDYIKKVFDNGKYKSIERKIVYKKTTFYYKIDISPTLNSKKEVYQAVVTISDITKNREAEEEIRKLDEFKKRVLNNVPVSIVMLDKKGKIVSQNKHALELLGKKHENTKLTSIKEIKNNKKLASRYDELIKKGKAFKHENLSYQSSNDPETKYLNIIAAPLFDARGGVDGAISIAVDNTEATMYREKIENLNQNLEKKVDKRTYELDTANKKLNRALELKLKFISDASHELRTPLTIMKGNLDLLFIESKKIDENLLETYRDIEDEIERMSRIISDLTMLTNADSEMEKLHYEKINIGKLVESVVKSLSVIAKEKNISLKFGHYFRAIFVEGDDNKLEKIVMNLVRNAIKYTDENGWIKISLNKDDQNVFLTIKDNGIGIPDKDLPNIFERFYRVDKARSRLEGGTGLGLSICKWMVEAHNGEILVKSKEGLGSEFTVRLPLNQKKS